MPVVVVFLLIVWYVLDPFTFQWSMFTLVCVVLATFFGRFAYVEWPRVPTRKPKHGRRYHE